MGGTWSFKQELELAEANQSSSTQSLKLGTFDDDLIGVDELYNEILRTSLLLTDDCSNDKLLLSHSLVLETLAIPHVETVVSEHEVVIATSDTVDEGDDHDQLSNGLLL